MGNLLYWFIPLLFIGFTNEIERTPLDDFIIPFRIFNTLRMNFLTYVKRQNRSFWDNDKLQEPIPESVHFPCDVEKSRNTTKPQSVHKLQPGDIDVIGAIGDSLTAGFGLTATNILEVFYEERGKSFSIGGEGDWRRYTTLPNILKVFNPNLIGYSLNSSLLFEPGAQLNVAQGLAISKDTPYMARNLIKKIKTDKRINVNEDWKMITIFIGANDFCAHICYLKRPESSLEEHRNDLIQSLRLLKKNLPRTFVNLIPAIHLKALAELKVWPSCYLTQTVSCPCLIGMPFKHMKPIMYNIMERWQKIDIEVSNMKEFHTNDFTVVSQPFILNFTVPTISNMADHRYLSSDCFHISQRLDAKAALDLWNNIMEPVGKKSTSDGSDFFSKFNCPNKKYPSIFTNKNSP